MCIYIYIYIVVKGNIIVTDPDNAKRNKASVFKNNLLFINCISKVNSVKIDNAEDLDVVMPTCHLLEDSGVSCGVVIEMNQMIFFLLILNLLNIKQVLQ